MTTQVQFRRGTTTEHSTFTGAVGEITVDTTKDTAVVHDGSTVGGVPLLRQDMGNVPNGTITSQMIADANVTYAKIQNVATGTLLGRVSGGSGIVQEIQCTAAGRALLDDVDAAAQRTTLGLGTAATSNTGDFATASHTHGNITNAGAIGTTANLPVITGTSGVLQAGSFGTAANTFCQGNDSRLSDQRTPTDDSVTDAKVASNAAIADTKLATISTAGKVSGTAITSGTIGGSTAISTSGSIATTSTLAVGQASAATNTELDLAGTYAQTVVAVGALDIDCSTGNYFTKTINGNSTFTVSNVPASRSYSFVLELEHTSGTITWFSGVEWPGGTAPTLTTGKTHFFIFHTDNGGTRWRASSLINYTT